MPYSEEIDSRIRKIVSRWGIIDCRKMFGGVCYLIRGNMFCGVYKDYLILRLGESQAVEALKTPRTRPFDITGRPMKGWIMIEGGGVENGALLEEWLDKARNFAETLPPK